MTDLLTHAQARYVQYPKLKILEESPETIKFILKECDVSIANALRRVMISEVPTLAIELVTVKENTSSLQDEIIAHRLGLIPIDSTNVASYVYKNKCNCMDYCNNCTARFTINAAAPPNSSYTITHKDLQELNPDVLPSVYITSKFAEATAEMDEDMSAIKIAKLPPNGRLVVDIQAVKGIGKLHAKWNPCATAVFRYIPIITINKDMQRSIPNKIKLEIMNTANRGLFKLINYLTEEEVDVQLVNYSNDISTNLDLVTADELKYNFNDDIKEILLKYNIKDYITIETVPNEYLFEVESVGQLPAKEIVLIATNVILKKLRKIAIDFAAQPIVTNAFGTKSTVLLDLE